MRSTVVVGALVISGVALGVTGCGWESDGPVSTQVRAIDEVTAVELKAPGDLTVQRGDTPSLTVTAGERSHERLTSEVRDGVLVLDMSKDWVSFGDDLKITLVVSELERIDVRGSGDVVADGVTGSELGIEINGSGDVEFDSVDADSVEVSVNGSGSVDVRGAAASADVSINGSGDVRVGVTESLTSSIRGSGSVYYAGNPVVTSDIQGSGDLRQE